MSLKIITIPFSYKASYLSEFAIEVEQLIYEFQPIPTL